MFNPLLILVTIFLLLIVMRVKSQDWKLHRIIDKFIYDECDVEQKQNGVTVKGVCTPIVYCPAILNNLYNGQYDHTVCGYEDKTQIVCCPSLMPNVNVQDVAKLNLYINVECHISNSTEIGVMKFLAECPELNKNNGLTELNRLCDHEICSDLVCCPVKLKSRLKKVCWNVDHPVDTLRLRLDLNGECTIKELNMKGKYQSRCDYAERNPHLISALRNVCEDDLCTFQYCCPIEVGDKFHCSSNGISSHIANLIGPKCVDSRTGKKGTCRREFDCIHRNKDSFPMDKCGSYCCSGFYCCPDFADTTKFQSLADKECFSYIKHQTKKVIEVPMSMNENNKNTNCILMGSAAGGLEVSPGSFPHTAALGYEVANQILWNCGGSLISDRFVLTAAHCLSNQEYGAVKKVRLGVIDLLNDPFTFDCPEDFNVAEIIPHPEYKTKYVYNDIGLVKLSDRVTYNYHIRPICLPTNSDLPEHFQSMGWGALGFNAEKSVKLIKVYQELFPYDECKELYSHNSNRKLNRGILNETHICAGSRHSIQSTCAGDSGGPLLGNHPIYPGLFNLYGIVSFGSACGFANNPGIYTKVFPYVKWIEEIVWT